MGCHLYCGLPGTHVQNCINRILGERLVSEKQLGFVCLFVCCQLACWQSLPNSCCSLQRITGDVKTEKEERRRDSGGRRDWNQQRDLEKKSESLTFDTARGPATATAAPSSVGRGVLLDLV